MQKKLLKHTENRLNQSLVTVGDMALKRRAKNIILGLELTDGDKVLEIGCGNGYYLSLINRLGCRISLTGIDNDKLALADAKKFINDNRVKLNFADAAKLPYLSNSFDKIIMSEVIEHVQNEQKCLSEAYRLLKPNGIFALTTCNIDYPFLWDPFNWILQHLFGIHIEKGFWAGIWNQHTRLYKKNKIRNLVTETGFKVDICKSLTFWCLPFNHYIVNLIAKLFYLHKLPPIISKGMNKFENNRQPFLISLGFKLINLFDKLNDLIPMEQGVSIFIKARKHLLVNDK